MQNRRLRNLPRTSQDELGHRFSWLKAVYEGECPKDVQVVSISVFDHWLTRDEANELLENVPATEQARRDALHADFCSRLIQEAKALSFTFRGIRKNNLLFREFTCLDTLSKYLTPNGGKTLRHREFHVVLPELGCAFYESWDDTHHFFFKDVPFPDLINQLAKKSGLYVLVNK